MQETRDRDDRRAPELTSFSIRPSTGGTVRDAEHGLTLGFVWMRLGTLLLVGLGTFRGLKVADNRPGYLLLSVLVSIVTLVVCRAVWRRGEVTAPWGWVDLTTSVLGLLGLALVLPASTLVGDWAAWGAGFATPAAVAAGSWTRSIRGTAVASGVLMAAYLLMAVPAAAAPLPVLLANALVFPIMGITAGVFIAYLRKIAVQAQQSHREAVDAAHQVELDRYRLLVHDATGILRLLGAEDTPRAMLPALRHQATTEASRLRRYLSDMNRADPGDPGSWTLGRVVDEAVDGFGDLPLEISTDLGGHVRLAEGDALALQRAVATVLHNCRRHSGARQVVIHADSTPPTWALVIRDDGVGFDMARTRLGYGVSVQVLGELDRRHLTVEIRSQPGAGTSVTVTGDELDE